MVSGPAVVTTGAYPVLPATCSNLMNTLSDIPVYFQDPMLRELLMVAIKAGDIDETQRLLSNGADVNSRGDRIAVTQDDQEFKIRSCPLLLAVIQRDAAMVKVLLEAGADPKLRCGLGIPCVLDSTVFFAHVVDSGDEKILQYLFEAGVADNKMVGDDSHIHGSFMRAAKSSPHLLKILAQYGADINSIDAAGDTNLLKALHYLGKDSFCVVKRLLAFGADVNISNTRSGITPLILAIKINCPKTVIELLLEKGANPHIIDRRTRTALNCAAKMSNVWALSRLIQENVNLEYRCFNCYKRDTTFYYLFGKCRRCLRDTSCTWVKPYYCLCAMDILMKAGANLYCGGYADPVEVIQGFGEQAELVYMDRYGGTSRGLGMEEKHIEKIRNILETLIWKFSNVDSLRHLCRLKIRAILKSDFKERLQMLHIPRVLYDYILMKDFLFLESWTFIV